MIAQDLLAACSSGASGQEQRVLPLNLVLTSTGNARSQRGMIRRGPARSRSRAPEEPRGRPTDELRSRPAKVQAGDRCNPLPGMSSLCRGRCITWASSCRAWRSSASLVAAPWLLSGTWAARWRDSGSSGSRPAEFDTWTASAPWPGWKSSTSPSTTSKTSPRSRCTSG